VLSPVVADEVGVIAIPSRMAEISVASAEGRREREIIEPFRDGTSGCISFCPLLPVRARFDSRRLGPVLGLSSEGLFLIIRSCAADIEAVLEDEGGLMDVMLNCNGCSCVPPEGRRDMAGDAEMADAGVSGPT